VFVHMHLALHTAWALARDGKMLSSLTTFAAYVGPLQPGTTASVDYMPASDGPAQAQRVAVTLGEGQVAARRSRQHRQPPLAACPRARRSLTAWAPPRSSATTSWDVSRTHGHRRRQPVSGNPISNPAHIGLTSASCGK
jgi:hypothetical protein